MHRYGRNVTRMPELMRPTTLDAHSVYAVSTVYSAPGPFGLEGCIGDESMSGPATESLEEYGYRSLRSMILGGELAAGQKLVQEDLAQRLGVSRTPLRSAIAALERDGFVTISPRGEATVVSFGPNRVADLFEVRAVLEGLTCRLIAPTIERRHTLYLRSLITTAMPAPGSEDWTAYRQADQEFHNYLTSLLTNDFLTRQLDSVRDILRLSFAQGLLRPPVETLEEHLQIIDALEAHDAEAAEQAMLSHIRTTIALMRARAAEIHPH
jgi:DNA-binding GntR family transcriptional regulator